jgi:hypothetical protein
MWKIGANSTFEQMLSNLATQGMVHKPASPGSLLEMQNPHLQRKPLNLNPF